MINAGFARGKITPREGLLMGGYRLRRGVALGTHDDLYATCVVISDGQTKVALISLDLLCLPHEAVWHLKEDISDKANIAPEQTIIACTHTHSGPGTLGLAGKNDANDDYINSLPDLVSPLVIDAHQRMRRTKVSILQTHIPDVAFNRRIKLKDGSLAINIDKINPQDVQSAGVTDPWATIIFFEVGAETIGSLVNFTLHPTILDETNFLYSRDYPGYLVDALNKQIPGKPLGLFFNGAFGNINQIKIPGEWISTYQEAQRIGRKIAGYLLKNRSRRIGLEIPTLAVKTESIYIPCRPPVSTSQTDLASEAIVGHDQNEIQQSGTHLSAEKEELFLLEVQSLAEHTQEQVELQILRFGEVEIFVLPGEIFVEMGIEVKKRSSNPYPLIFGNANGYIGYVPTVSAFKEGGYETRLSLTSRLIPEAGEIISSHIDEMRMEV